MWGNFLTPKEQRNEDMQFIHNWLDESSGRIAYTTGGAFNDELNKIHKAKRWLMGNLESGKAKLISPEACADAEKEFPIKEIMSDDPHILALAKAGNIKILCTNDKKLKKDFKNRIKGKIYETKEEHGKMLLSNHCP